MRFTVDSNILVYAFDRVAGERHVAAANFMILAELADGVITAQALGEFIAVIHRKQPKFFSEALEQVYRWQIVFPVVETRVDDILRAAIFAQRQKLQYWDSLIWQVARSAGANFFVSEDMQDGVEHDGLTVINPFNPSNRARLREILRGRPEKL